MAAAAAGESGRGMTLGRVSKGVGTSYSSSSSSSSLYLTPPLVSFCYYPTKSSHSFQESNSIFCPFNWKPVEPAPVSCLSWDVQSVSTWNISIPDFLGNSCFSLASYLRSCSLTNHVLPLTVTLQDDTTKCLWYWAYPDAACLHELIVSTGHYLPGLASMSFQELQAHRLLTFCTSKFQGQQDCNSLSFSFLRLQYSGLA